MGTLYRPGGPQRSFHASSLNRHRLDAGSEELASPDGGAPDRVLPAPKVIRGSYIVLLAEMGVDGKPVKVRTVAQRLAKRYGGKITFIYELLPGFAIQGLTEEKAAALRKEPMVRGIDQDRAMQLTGPIKTQEPRQ